jgi:hypothetical protein
MLKPNFFLHGPMPKKTCTPQKKKRPTPTHQPPVQPGASYLLGKKVSPLLTPSPLCRTERSLHNGLLLLRSGLEVPSFNTLQCHK